MYVKVGRKGLIVFVLRTMEALFYGHWRDIVRHLGMARLPVGMDEHPRRETIEMTLLSRRTSPRGRSDTTCTCGSYEDLSTKNLPSPSNGRFCGSDS
jgi:hypothetical protein